MEKSISQMMNDDWEKMRVPTKDERDFAVSNRKEYRATLCCKVAEAWVKKRKLFLRDLEALNALMQKK